MVALWFPWHNYLISYPSPSLTLCQLQERLLKHELCNTVDTSLNMSGGGGQNNHLGNMGSVMNNHRAESVPPSVAGLLTTATANGSSLMHGPHGSPMNNPMAQYMRAQSEQPQQFFGGPTASANFGNAPQQANNPLSPVATMFPMYNNHNHNNQQSMLMRGGQQHQNMQAKALNNMTNNLSNNRIARVTGNVQMPQHMQSGGGGPDHLFGNNNILNLNPLTNNANNLSSNANLDHLPPIHHHFGGHPHPSNMHQLNNQVAPGNRANNYWDNFRR